MDWHNNKKTNKQADMLRDNELRPLNLEPCLPILSEGVANWSDIPSYGYKIMIE